MNTTETERPITVLEALARSIVEERPAITGDELRAVLLDLGHQVGRRWAFTLLARVRPERPARATGARLWLPAATLEAVRACQLEGEDDAATIARLAGL